MHTSSSKPLDIAQRIAEKLPPFKSKASQKVAVEIIAEELAKFDGIKFLEELEDYSFLLPKAERDKALKFFNETGEVEIVARRTTEQTIVRVNRIGEEIPGGVVPEEITPSPEEFDPEVLREDERNGPRTNEVDQGGPSDDKPAPPQRKSNVAILLPTSRDYNPRVLLSIFGQWKATLPENLRPYLAQLEMQPDTLLHNSRNMLADRFLKSEAEWSFWMDSDVLAPIGNPAWMQKWVRKRLDPQFFSTPAIERMMSHGKTIVSAILSERGYQERLVAPKGFVEQHGEAIKESGPRNELLETAWIPFACCVVHRKVFEAIKTAHPELAPKEEGGHWQFFSAELGLGSEDVAFAKRAKDAGHTCYFDRGLFVAHIGNHAFMP